MIHLGQVRKEIQIKIKSNLNKDQKPEINPIRTNIKKIKISAGKI